MHGTACSLYILMHININQKASQNFLFHPLTTFVKWSPGEDPQQSFWESRVKPQHLDHWSARHNGHTQVCKNGFPTFWFQAQSSGSQVVVGSAVRSPHTASLPCFQLLHHIKRQLKIHAFLILLFQVSNCCTCHKDVIWLWSKRNMNHDSKNGKVEWIQDKFFIKRVGQHFPKIIIIVFQKSKRSGGI